MGRGRNWEEHGKGGGGGDKASYDSCLIHSHNPKAVMKLVGFLLFTVEILSASHLLFGNDFH